MYILVEVKRLPNGGLFSTRGGEHMSKAWAKKFYNSAKWKRVRDYVITREHGLCSECHRPGYIVHHIKPLTERTIRNPAIALNPNNLTYLCHDCHNRMHGVYKKAKPKPYRITKDGEIIPR